MTPRMFPERAADEYYLARVPRYQSQTNTRKHILCTVNLTGQSTRTSQSSMLMYRLTWTNPFHEQVADRPGRGRIGSNLFKFCLERPVCLVNSLHRTEHHVQLRRGKIRSGPRRCYFLHGQCQQWEGRRPPRETGGERKRTRIIPDKVST